MYFGDQCIALATPMLLQKYLPGRHAQVHRKGRVYCYYFTPSLTADASLISVQMSSTSLVEKKATLVHHLSRDTGALLRSAIRGHVCRRCAHKYGQSFTGCPMVLLFFPVWSLPTIGIGQEELI